MNFYNNKIFPILNNVITKCFAPNRKKILSDINGDVLEIGFGSGQTLYEYTPAVRNLVGLEPSTAMSKKLCLLEKPNNFTLIHGCAENIPLVESSFDYVVSFLTLCSVSDLNKSILEVKRVLKPGGHFIFIEHVAKKRGTFGRKLQDLIGPLWKIIGCGVIQIGNQ